MFLMLKPSWPGEFRRTLRDELGKPKGVLVFAPQQPIDVADEDLPQLTYDLRGPVMCVQMELVETEVEGQKKVEERPTKKVDVGETEKLQDELIMFARKQAGKKKAKASDA